MISFGKFITKHKNIILAIGILLLIPSVFGYANTRVNYDVLTYLPKDIETMEGQEIDGEIRLWSLFDGDGRWNGKQGCSKAEG